MAQPATSSNGTEEGWQGLVAKKQQHIQQEFPSAWRLPENVLAEVKGTTPGVDLISSNVMHKVDFFSADEVYITEKHTAVELIQKLASGEITSTAVTTAFCKRAAVAQQLCSCLTETFFPEALERAKYLDEYLHREGKVVGPLHGLPISIKDSFQVKGKQSTIGYVSFIEHPPAERNSALVDLLLNLGAVIYVKTNIPQTLMTGDSDNNIFGRTLNPHNTSLTAGGSSGGEGALVAFRGSILGVGTDVAGSIRIPALCCGVYGFRPTADRVPYGGQVSGYREGIPGLVSTAGPLAQSLDDIELFMSSVVAAEPWRYDVSAMGAPWTSQYQHSSSDEIKLTIGVLDEHPHFPLHPPVRRALDSAVEALQKKGHRIVHLERNPKRDLALGNRVAFQYFTYVGPAKDHIAASGEPAVPSVAMRSSPMFTGPFSVASDLSPFDTIEQLHHARAAFTDSWRTVWVEKGLDVILAPGAQNTAVPHDSFGWPPYTCIWNLLDYPACIIPYGKASKELDPTPMRIEDGVQPSYDPEAVDSAPCAIQIIAPRFQDEKCLAASRIIDRDIR